MGWGGRRNRERIFYPVKAAREKVALVFKQLRKEGFIARMNFSCCGSCAGYEIGQEFDDAVKNGLPKEKWPRGGVFWNKQSDASFWEDGELYIAYGAITAEASKASTPLTDKQVGDRLKQLLDEQGLAVDWDGDPDKKIKVLALKEPEPALQGLS